ncbi:outer membrane protein [Neotabrizicola sp. VNH66]|uniref:outer membrane protein n=1 Tax=Neotabrizicola sp. VNH66 TaxID=3400918 RepID=UPI003C111987
MSHKSAVLAAIIALSGLNPAYADGMDPVVAERGVPVLPPDIADWSGFYVGLGYGSLGGKIADAIRDFDLDDTTSAAFIGYSRQSGHVVYGVELAYSKGADDTINGREVRGDGMVALTGRLGYAWKKSIVYARIGYAISSYEIGGAKADYDGVAYGIGFDHRLNDRLSVGLAVTNFDLSSADSAAQGIDIKPQQLDLRLNLRF